MEKLQIDREDGQLRVKFSIKKNQSMLETEEQIDRLIESVKEELSDIEMLRVKQQIIQAIKNIK